MSLGHAMLIQEGDAEELEDILLLVPQAMVPPGGGKPDGETASKEKEGSRSPVERLDMHR
jgi:hypothetical protein